MDPNWFNLTHRPVFKNYDGHAVKWGERKHNGHRYTLVKYPDGSMRAYGARAIDTFDNLPEHLQILLEGVPNGSVLDGELVAPSDEASDVTHLLANASPRLQFRVFAVPHFGNANNRRLQRAETEELYQHIQCYGFETVQLFDVAECTLQNAKTARIEGWVLKSRHYEGWYKYKPQRTCDVIVVEVVQGYEGKFRNCWGSLICSVYKEGKLTQIASVAKGKDDQWRWLPKEQIIGRVCEISHEGVQSLGRLKFSAFMRWRDDKLPEQCLYDQLT